MNEQIQGDSIVSGSAKGTILFSDEPLSFWGGYDQNTGEIIDRRHPLSGQIAAERVLALPFSRGSSTGTAVLLEAIRADKAPVAILTTGIDTFFALASIVAAEMYGKPIPIIALSTSDFIRLRNGGQAEIYPNGAITIHQANS
ncbi:MAG: DUF126 domain-containing protein [Chloroflexota bacterium]|nr:DUF126 domain-containing protein [Chloroflexota bacterium]